MANSPVLVKRAVRYDREVYGIPPPQFRAQQKRGLNAMVKVSRFDNACDLVRRWANEGK